MRPGAGAIRDPREIAAAAARALGARDDVVFAYLFGSLAAARPQGPRSDVDVAVWLRPRAPAEAMLDLHRILAEALRRSDIDVVVLNDAPLSLAAQAIRGDLMLDRDEEARVAFESGIMSRYRDRLPYHRRHLALEGMALAERGFS
ncbi:MAG: nucleotidyltransferase domain-containing protein [Candidatus Thermoplasmatota archaeon]